MSMAEDFFEVAFTSSPLGIAGVDIEGRFFRTNPALQHMLGRSEREFDQLKFFDLIRSPEVGSDRQRFEDVLSGQRENHTFEREFLHADGSTRWGRCRLSRHRGLECPFVLATVEDVGASRAAERVTQDIAHRLGERIKELTALHQTAALILHGRGTWEERMQAVAALLPAAMQYPEITTGCIRCRGQTFATVGHEKTSWVLSVPWTMADGSIGEIEVAYHEPKPDSALGPFLTEELALLKSLAEMLHTSLDRDRAEEALRAANERFRLALMTAGMGIWEWDIARNTVCWSEPLPFMAGLQSQMKPFGTYTHLVHPDDLDYVLGRLARAADGEDDLRYIECRFRRPDGTWRSWLGSGWIERVPPARATRILVALIDVTERRAMEERLRQAQKVEALGQVAGGVAHDFNNILGVLFSGIDLLRHEIPEGHPWGETIDDLSNACERGQALTRQLLAFSRKMQFQPAAIDLAQLMTKLRPLLVRVVGDPIQLFLEIDPAAGAVWADPAQIEQIVMNLVVNARDAMLEGGRITVAVRLVDEVAAPKFGVASGRYVALVVQDNGVGIPAEILPKIFEPFFTTKEVGKGTGLGLAVVADIARRWQGHVHIDSKLREGSTFSVLFPQMRVHEKEIAA